MSTDTTKLNKGDLVMTEHGLAWYDVEIHENGLLPDERGKGWKCIAKPILGKDFLFSKQATKAARQQVEAYLKEKGWYWKESIQYDEVMERVDCSHYLKEGGNHWLWTDDKGVWFVTTHAITPPHFDAAPAQQAEAILLAKMLNATKD